MTPEKQAMLEIPFMEDFGEDSRTMSFVSGLFWSVDSNGQSHWNIPDCVGSLGLAALMIICCSTIVVCAVKTYKKMNDSSNSLSDRTKELNRQLFVTLSLQTLLPFTLMYGPVGLLFLFPMFQIKMDILSSSAAASTAIYPAVEPLIAIFCIKTFRKSLICYRSSAKISSAAASTIRSS
uniref:G protein-coupled receptor n=1 Tax=Caenorhabditis tropicalis TaxID=1561998 RepID=A0A1I7THK7_9PELO